MLTIRDLQYLTKIAQYKSIAVAAKDCAVSQPALSIQLKKIEDHLGFKAFERVTKGSFLVTAKGQKLVDGAAEILAKYREIEQINDERFVSRIAIIPSISPYLLPKVASKLKQLKTANAKLYFNETKTAEGIKDLRGGKIDALIYSHSPDLITPDLNFKRLYKEEFFAVVPKNSRLGLAEVLASGSVILLEEGNCMSEDVVDICSSYKFKADNSYYSTSIEVVKSMIRVNNGYGVLPQLALENDRSDFRLIAFTPKKYRQIAVAYRNNCPHRKVIEEIAKIISEEVN